MTLRPSTYTFGDLSRAVKRVFGDESGVQLEQQDIVDFANRGIQTINTENAVLKSRSTASTVAGQRQYQLPPAENTLRIESIHLDGRLLKNLSFQEAEATVIEVDPDFEQSGLPEFWYSWDDDFYFWPKPDQVYAIDLYTTRYHTKLTGDSAQLIDLSDKWFQPLVDFVLQQAYEMDEDWNASQMKAKQFAEALASQSQEEEQAQWGSYPVVREV